MEITYSVSIHNLHAHLFEVKLLVPKPNLDSQIFSLPNWIPGSYLVRDFAKHIIQISAMDEQGEIAITATDKNHWQVNNAQGELEIIYQVYAFDQSVRGAFLSIERGFFNGTNLLLAVEGKTQNPSKLVVQCPPRWQIATSLKPHPDNEGFCANNYQDLIDAPVEMSDFVLELFNSKTVPHRIAISGKHQAYHPRLVKDIAKICDYHQDFFGDTPFEDYLFLLLTTLDNYGGLEHKNSSSLICERTSLPNPFNENISPEYTRLLGLFSHEYIHAWWIKRLKPKNFHNLNLNTETYTKQLWIFEGWTSYFDDLSLLKVKILSPEQYLSLFAQTINRVISGTAAEKQSLIDSSFSTWSKFYQPNENTANAVVSYYTKGSLVAFMLDIEIRQRTENKHSLNTLMRKLWQDFADTGLEDDSAQIVLEKLTNSNFSDFFNRYIHGVDILPLQAYFFQVGIQYETVASLKDNISIDLNCEFKNHNNLVLITQINDNTSTQEAGLYVGDTLIAINGAQVLYSNLSQTLAAYPAGAKVRLTIFREGILTHLEITLEEKINNIAKLTLLSNPNDAQKAMQNAWFYH